MAVLCLAAVLTVPAFGVAQFVLRVADPLSHFLRCRVAICARAGATQPRNEKTTNAAIRVLAS
jgi:hypothetical protein